MKPPEPPEAADAGGRPKTPTTKKIRRPRRPVPEDAPDSPERIRQRELVEEALRALAEDQRTRNAPFTAEAQEDFMALIGHGMAVLEACRELGLGMTTVYRAAQRDAEFERAWDFARAVRRDSVEIRLLETALYAPIEKASTTRAAISLMKLYPSVWELPGIPSNPLRGSRRD